MASIIGGSKKRTTTYVTSSEINGNEGQAFSNIGSGAEINVLDGGAIAGAFAATANALTFAEKAGKSALDFAFNAGRPEAAAYQKQLYIAGAVLGLFVVVYFSNSKKGKRK